MSERVTRPWRSYEDIAVRSAIEGFGRTISGADLLMFTALAVGFHQPLHTNREWVKVATPFPERLLPGPAILAYSIGLLSATLVYSDVTIAFLGLDELRVHAPVVAGDTITPVAMVASKRLST